MVKNWTFSYPDKASFKQNKYITSIDDYWSGMSTGGKDKNSRHIQEFTVKNTDGLLDIYVGFGP